jgi:tetratricopeptide (TPR) repeat protein
MRITTTLLLTALAVWQMAFTCNKTKLSQSTQTPLRMSVADTSGTLPQLTILHKKEQETEPFLQTLSVKVETWGSVSVTTMDMVFYNPNERLLEAEMVFPLGENQHISRLAVEKNGSLQEGVVVEKNKGQQVFEDIERRNVDPVLVEHVAGNNYRARIYPVPGHGTKRIVIAYEQELSVHDTYLLYHLPLAYNIQLSQFNLEAIVHNATPDSIALDRPQIKPAFQFNEGDWTSSTQLREHFLEEHFAFIIPHGDKNEMRISQFDHNENKTYFYTTLILPDAYRPKPRPEKIAFYWDVSGSCDSLSQSRYRALVSEYLLYYKPSVVEVFPFSYTVHEKKSFSISNGNSQELTRYLEGLNFDGGTQLGSIRNDGGYNEVFVFSDGMTNYGKDLPELIDIPVNCISASVHADFGLLRTLSEQTGGTAINLLQNNLPEAMKKLTTQPLKLISATVTDISGNRTKNGIYPSGGIIEGNSLNISGYCEVPGNLILQIGYDVSSSYVVEVNTAPNSNGVLAKRMWGQKKMEALSIRADKNKDEMLATAKKFQLVTPLTSLIFLDTITDYIAYEIEPPGAMKEAYFKALAEKEKIKEDENIKHIEQVVNWLAEREEWWKKDFTSEHKISKKKLKTNNGLDGNQQILFNSIEVNEESPTASDLSEEPPAELMFDAISQSAHQVGAGSGAGSNMTFSISDKSKEEEEKVVRSITTQKTVELAKWNPDTPYLNKLKNTANNDLYQTYQNMRKEYAHTPSFFVDVADYFMQAGQSENALRVLSNLAEVDIKNYRLMRILAHRLEQMNRPADAVHLFSKVMELRKEEPQSYRDLALAMAANNQHQEAIEILYQLITKEWHGRFTQIELIAVGELNQIIQSSPTALNTSLIDPRLLKHMPMDARVVLNWDADNCDIDLWVTDPRGEKCFYGHRDTKIGGHNSADLTGGYGPEEFIIKKAMKGKYNIEINYFGDRQQSIEGPTTIQVEVYTDYGKASQKVNKITRRLSNKSETLEIGAFEVEID